MSQHRYCMELVVTFDNMDSNIGRVVSSFCVCLLKQYPLRHTFDE